MSEPIVCPACRLPRAADRLLPAGYLPPSLAAAVATRHPAWSPQEAVCAVCASEARTAHLTAVARALGSLDEPHLARLRQDQPLPTDVNRTVAHRQGAAERLALRVAEIVGSWRFSGLVLAALLSWIGVNLWRRPFDPFPIIVLAVISAALGSLAALQGPVILMAQRRQRQQEQLQAAEDYLVNLKAELEVQLLHEKVDRLAQLVAAQREPPSPA